MKRRTRLSEAIDFGAGIVIECDVCGRSIDIMTPRNESVFGPVDELYPGDRHYCFMHNAELRVSE